MNLHPLARLAPARAAGTPSGITSVCSAHPLVLDAALLQAQADGQLKIIEQSPEWVEPLPYWAYEGEVCTPTGLKQKQA